MLPALVKSPILFVDSEEMPLQRLILDTFWKEIVPQTRTFDVVQREYVINWRCITHQDNVFMLLELCEERLHLRLQLRSDLTMTHHL